MVKALVDISNRTNRILNMVKAKYGLRNKSEAIDKVLEEYENEILEPELRPEFIEEMRKIEKESIIKVDNFAKEFGLE
jgi:Protein of unknown function (DUF2683).